MADGAAPSCVILCPASLPPAILGQLRSSVILVSKTKKTTFQIHYIALSANVIDLLRYMPPARAPMTWVASIMKKAVLSGDSARMTREQ